MNARQINPAVQFLSNLYKAFLDTDASLLEINPFITTTDGRLFALDAKLTFDDNALFRHHDIRELRDITAVSYTHLSDIDHTGVLSEAIVTLPETIPPKGTVDLEIAYEGIIVLDVTRLTRIGTPDSIARSTDWDQISTKFTAVRGLSLIHIFIRHEGSWLQLRPQSRRYGPTQSKALVCAYEDGGMEVYYRGERIEYREIAEPVREVVEPQRPAARLKAGKKAKPDHPWRLGYEMRVALRTPLAAPPVVQRPSASP